MKTDHLTELESNFVPPDDRFNAGAYNMLNKAQQFMIELTNRTTFSVDYTAQVINEMFGEWINEQRNNLK